MDLDSLLIITYVPWDPGTHLPFSQWLDDLTRVDGDDGRWGSGAVNRAMFGASTGAVHGTVFGPVGGDGSGLDRRGWC